MARASLVESGSFRSQHSLLPWHRAMLRWPREYPGMRLGHALGHCSHGPCPLHRAPLKTGQQGPQRQGQSALKAAPRLEGEQSTTKDTLMLQGGTIGSALQVGDPMRAARASVVTARQPGLRRAGNKAECQPHKHVDGRAPQWYTVCSRSP